MGEKLKIVYHVSPISSIYKLRKTGKNKGLQAARQGCPGVYVCPSFRDAVKWATSFVAHKKSVGNYKKVTIYKIEIPESILKKSWYDDNWEKEYFISEENIDSLQIISSETLTFAECIGMQNKWCYKNNEAQNKDIVKFSKKYPSNLAAKLYLKVKEEFVELALEGQLFDNKTKNELFFSLEKYMWEDYQILKNKPKDRLTFAETKAVEKIIAKLRELMKKQNK